MPVSSSCVEGHHASEYLLRFPRRQQTQRGEGLGLDQAVSNSELIPLAASPTWHHLQSTDPPCSAGGSQGTSRGRRGGPGPPEHRPPVISNVPSDPLSEGLPLRSQRQLDPSCGGRWPGTGPEKIARRREGGLGGGRHSAWELAHHLHIPDGETEDRHRGGTAQSH